MTYVLPLCFFVFFFFGFVVFFFLFFVFFFLVLVLCFFVFFFQDDAYVSTSVRLDGSWPFTGGKCCLLKILIPAGMKVLPLYDISDLLHEYEILLPRGSRFEQVSSKTIHYNGESLTMYTMKYLGSVPKPVNYLGGPKKKKKTKPKTKKKTKAKKKTKKKKTEKAQDQNQKEKDKKQKEKDNETKEEEDEKAQG